VIYSLAQYPNAIYHIALRYYERVSFAMTLTVICEFRLWWSAWDHVHDFTTL